MKEGHKRKIDQRETTIEDLKAKLKEYQHMKGWKNVVSPFYRIVFLIWMRKDPSCGEEKGN